MKKTVLLIAAAGLLISCVTAPSPSSKPKWVDDKYSAYPENDYMVEIGQGSSLKDARANAASALAQIFKTSIKVEMTIQTRYRELSSGGSVQASEETNYDENITQLADQELVNVNFGESWTNDLGQVHVIAYIDRKETAQIYRRRIMENGDTVGKFLGEAGRQQSRIEKYAFLDAAYVVAETNRTLIEQLEIINQTMSRTIMLSYDLDNIRNMKRDAARNMSFRLSIAGDDEGKVSAALSEELTANGFSIDPRGVLEVNGSVAFEKVQLDNKYENLKYYLVINMVDEKGIPVVSMEKNDRVSAVSASDVKNRAYVEIVKVIGKELMKQWTIYLDSFAK